MRTERGRRHRGLVVSLLVWLAVAACAVSAPPRTVEVDLEADVGVAGAFVEFVAADAVTSVSATPLRPETLVRAEVVDGVIRVAWVGSEALSGSQVRVSYVAAVDDGDLPNVATAQVFSGFESDSAGSQALEVKSPSGALPSTVPLQLAAVDHRNAGPVVLARSFADRPLGDLNADGVLDVRDALLMLERTRDQAWSAYQRYHADLDADDVTDSVDLTRLLDKLVDPGLPARLHVKPRLLSFVELDSATDREALVLIANQGRAPLGEITWRQVDVNRAGGVSMTSVGGLGGQSSAWVLSLPADQRRGWVPGVLRVGHTGSAGTADVRVGDLVVLVAGQSNAQGVGYPLASWPETPVATVRMLGNDYVWKDASEPLDDPTDQVDTVSLDANPLYSFGTRLGNLLHDWTGFTTHLIPAALGGTSSNQWQPPAQRLDRGTLFGSANFRAHVSAGLRENPIDGQQYGSEGGPVTVLAWYQGESDSGTPSLRTAFQVRTHSIMDAFVADLGVHTVYVQLASQHDAQENIKLHAVAELQRQMETDWGTPGQRREDYHMVVAFDLPRSDRIHLSAYGQRVLAERIALAIRQHVLGEAVDGTGPRLTSGGLTWSGTEVRITTTHLLATEPIDAGYFAVYDGPPANSIDDVESYGTNAIGIVEAVVDPHDAKSVRLVLERAPALTPWVRYMALPGVGESTWVPSKPEAWEELAAGVVVAAAGRLPLPVFGPLPTVAAP